MDPNTYVNVDFTNIKWPNNALPNKVSKNVRFEFLMDKNGEMFGHKDLKSILTSWLHDEFNVCPIDFNFQVVP